MPNPFEEVVDSVQNALAAHAGQPIDEQIEGIVVDLALELGTWAAGAALDPADAPSDPLWGQGVGSPYPAVDPPDAGATDPSGVPLAMSDGGGDSGSGDSGSGVG
jgi:hypothetical protein